MSVAPGTAAYSCRMPPIPPRSYRTIATAGTAELEVRRSRFVADVVRVTTEDEARAVIDAVRARSRDAGHHCTAFVLGPAGGTRRSNDDGEPSGTAGAPMLDVLTGRGLGDVVAVVSRWFGGTLLGTGGLIRAYGDAVAAALDTAGELRREVRVVWAVDVDHTLGPRVENALRELSSAAVTATTWTVDGLRVEVAVAPRRVAALTTLVAELTAGRSEPVEVGRTWVDVAVPAAGG